MNSNNFIQSIIYGFGAAVGFSLVLILFAAMRERLVAADVPAPFRGVSIAMVTRLELTPADDGLEKLLPIFERGHVAMVAEGEQLVGLLTRVDLPGWLRAVLD